MKKRYYRVCNTTTQQGLWYNFQGDFTGLIHGDFNFCKNSELPMDFDEEIVGWLSATDNLTSLFEWFPIEDIVKLQEFGWYLHVYDAEDVKFYEKFQHEVIKQTTSTLLFKLEAKLDPETNEYQFIRKD